MSTEGPIDISIGMDDVMLLQPILQRSLNSALYRAKQRIEHEILPLLPFRTGRLQESLRISHSGLGINIEMDPVDEYGHHYGRIVEMGAEPHIIEPLEPGGALHFWAHGQEVFAKSVQHPGYSGRGFLAELKALVVSIVRDEIGQAITREFSRGATLR